MNETMTKTYRQGVWIPLTRLLPMLLCPLAHGGVTLSSDTVKDPGPVVELGVDLDRNDIIEFDKLDADNNLVASKDRTSLNRPFRFWINNDYDAVLYKDQPPKLDRKTCGDLKTENGRQVCEQDDYRKGGSNIDGANLTRIESIRDLEDFIPLALRIAPWSGKVEGIKIKVRAVGIRVNLFKGEWKEGSEYLTNASVAAEQVKADHLVTLDANWWEVPRALIEVQGGGTGTGLARFILEGLSGTDRCGDNPKDCYLEVRLEDASGAEVVSSKTYLQLYDITAFYDHYSVGTGTSGPPSASADPPIQAASRSLKPNLRVPATDGSYILFVHGWRMKAAERVNFAETALKRLYWSGYQGRFGLFSWPTEYFDKPPWVTSTVEQLFRVLGNAQNYDNSEAIARRSGAPLASLLSAGSLSTFKVSVFAHSMGNVVVSEALKQASTTLVNTYVATQAAETADAYNPAAPERNSTNANSRFPYDRSGLGLDWFVSGGGCSYTLNEYVDLGQRTTSTPIESYPNVDNDVPPDQDSRFTRCEIPDKYSYYTASAQNDGSPQRRHYEDVKRTTGISLPAGENFPRHYYAGIVGKTDSGISNYFNEDDFALDGWEFNAMTKPDFLNGSTWRYAGTVSFDAATAGPLWVLEDQFTRDGNVIDWAATDTDQFEIMAHIIPARSKALGAQSGLADGQGEIDSQENLGGVIAGTPGLGFTNQAYDHSAEFLSSYVVRKPYWNKIKGALTPKSAK